MYLLEYMVSLFLCHVPLSFSILLGGMMYLMYDLPWHYDGMTYHGIMMV